MSRRKIAAGNWKMNLNRQQALELATQTAHAAANIPAVETYVFPPYPWLASVRTALSGSQVRLGAQNCHPADSGAFTGEVSVTMLGELVTAVIAGHSERRHLFGESDALVGEKVASIVRLGMQAFLCVGETLVERESGDAEAVVNRQLEAGLAEIDVEELDNIVIAYEPVWAIGTGVAATALDAQEMASHIRARLGERRGPKGALVRILYGGSVTPDNAAELFALPDVDGGLVGGASLKAATFVPIMKAAAGTADV